MNKERLQVIFPDKSPPIVKRLRAIAKGTAGVFQSIGDLLVELNKITVEGPDEGKSSGWQDPDDDDIQFLHNGAPYNR